MTSSPPTPKAWKVAGTYFEACNCQAVCPCRSVDGGPGGLSTYGTCQFVLSWQVREGFADDLDLSGLSTVMAGWYSDDGPPSEWQVCLYIDEHANNSQFDALAAIFLGRAGGGTFANFARAIAVVHDVRHAWIELSHERRRWGIKADTFLQVSATRPFSDDGAVSCGIPGHEHPGTEVVSDLLRVNDGPLQWDLRERCGFTTEFTYAADTA